MFFARGGRLTRKVCKYGDGMNILITGGAGYIGSVICREALSRGHRVRVVDALWFDADVPNAFGNNPAYEFRNIDLCLGVPGDIFGGIDFVVHAAAVVGEPASKLYPELTTSVNYGVTMKLLDMIKKHKVKGFVFLSTCSNYGVVDGMADEKSGLQPLSLYAKTKVDVERHLMDKVDWVDWVICRLSTVYGVSPRMRFDLTVNDFTLKAMTEKKLDIFLPYTYRPYIHVADVANVINTILGQFDKAKNEIFNVGFDGENHQKMHIAQSIRKFLPEFEITINNKGADLRDYRVNFSKLKKLFGLNRKMGLDDGIREVMSLIGGGSVKNWRDPKYYNTSPKLNPAMQPTGKQ